MMRRTVRPGFSTIARRVAIAPVLTLALLVTPLGVEAQQAGKVRRVGVILTTSPVSEMAGPEPAHPYIRAFVLLRADQVIE